MGNPFGYPDVIWNRFDERNKALVTLQWDLVQGRIDPKQYGQKLYDLSGWEKQGIPRPPPDMGLWSDTPRNPNWPGTTTSAVPPGGSAPAVPPGGGAVSSSSLPPGGPPTGPSTGPPAKTAGSAGCLLPVLIGLLALVSISVMMAVVL